jgi:predicted transcriptional regulator
MKELSDIHKKYGIPEDIPITVFDYASIPTPILIEKISKLKLRLGGNGDETMEDSLEINEYNALKEELNRRNREGETVLSLNDDFASLITQSRVKLIALLQLSGGAHSIRELAYELGRPEKSVSRDVEILERHGLVDTMEVSDKRGRRREVRVGATKLVLVSESQQGKTEAK